MLSYVSIDDLDALIARALQEDLGDGDVTTEATIPADTQAEAYFLAKADGVLAGVFVAERVFKTLDDSLVVDWDRDDGATLQTGERFGALQGSAHAILRGERLALNFMQRMSGIATATAHMVAATGSHNAQILDTRKTAPGLRVLDKWAVFLGGGANHRIGLYDMIMVKDNHIAAAGGIRPAIKAAQAYRDSFSRPLEIEVETRTMQEVKDALAVGDVDRLLLDNMVRIKDGQIDTSMLEEAVRLIDGRIKTEASGNVTLETVPAIAATGVDYISSGALTHSVIALDISLKVKLNL